LQQFISYNYVNETYKYWRVIMNEQIEKLVAPIQELSTLAVSNIEKLTALQLKSIEENANTSVDALKSAAAIKDVEGFRSYISAQAEAAKEIATSAEANARAIAELGKSYAEEAGEIVKGALPRS
jgi:phasin family protein